MYKLFLDNEGEDDKDKVFCDGCGKEIKEGDMSSSKGLCEECEYYIYELD